MVVFKLEIITWMFFTKKRVKRGRKKDQRLKKNGKEASGSWN